jgi:hypothetical protein
MTINEALRLIAGAFVLASLLLGVYVNAWWFLFTGFVAVNLMQSAFTHWCPMMWILAKAGLRTDAEAERSC